MIFLKLLFLLAALKLHDYKQDPLNPALLFSVPIPIVSLFFGAPIIRSILFGVVTFLAAYAYFLLLSRFDRGIENYVIMAIGGGILLFVL